MTSDQRDARQGDSGRGAARDPHAERESSRYESPIASREHILATLASTKGPVDLERLGEILGTDTDEDATEALRRRVMAMQRDGQLVLNRKRGLVPVDDDTLLAGRVSAHKDGFGFFVTDEEGDDVFLNARQMRQVLHGDRAIVSVTGTDRRGRREGRIVEVVERANATLVGRLVVEQGVAFLSPDNRKIHQDLMLGSDGLGGASPGDMVVGEIVEQPTYKHPPLGRVIEVLGQHLDAGMEIDVALKSAGIPDTWPEAVEAQARRIPAEVEERHKSGRKDLRGVPLVTIDGLDARDFDDAVWCERAGKGWRLIVAIADVAHYVEPGTPLDDEAVNRGTSVYFPGRVVPMLPESLSNGLCSLNPDVDRLCMLCDMTLDERGMPRRTRFHNGVMRSHARFTYDKVAGILDDPSSASKEHAPLVPMLQDLHSLYVARAKARKRRGAIEFESNETHIVFDENRKIEKLVPIERNDAHKLIEECMILANIAAATLLERYEMPALYRVHPRPKADKLEDLRAFLALRGLTLGGGDSPTALDYAALAQKIAERTDRHVIQTVMLRSMQQAIYTPKNEGHFGLALDEYAHFTSPIRRYPDLLVHRGIKHLIARGTPENYTYTVAAMQALGDRCSMTERRAEEASRDVVSWLKCEYMLEHVGDEFEGTVASVTSFGLFVELNESRVEGLIHITNLAHDYYRFDQAAHALKGDRTGRTYRLGDAMVVRVAGVNLDERKIDFEEVSHVPAEKVARGAPDASDDAGKASGKTAGKGDEDGSGRSDEEERRRADQKRARKQGKREAERAAEAVMNGAGPGPDAQASADAGADSGADDDRKRRKKKRKRNKRRDGEAVDPLANGSANASANGAADAGAKASADGAPASDASVAEAPRAGSGGADASAPDDGRGTVSERVPAAGSEAVPAPVPGSPGSEGGPDLSSASVPAKDRPADDASASLRYEVGQRPAPQGLHASTPERVAPESGPASSGAADDGEPHDPTNPDAAEADEGPSGQVATAKKAASKKAAGKKAAAKKTAAKQAAAKKAAGKKTVAGKAAGKKASGKKTAAKKAAGKKASGKKTAAKKVSTKKATAKKAAAKKAAAKKAAGEKGVGAGAVEDDAGESFATGDAGE